MSFLTDLFQGFGLDCSEKQEQAFETYFRLLTDWNERINLTAITEHDEVMSKHFADSVLPLREIPEGASLCDVGTGAGFPGIPLKILRPDLKLTLVDSLNKRILFLEEVVRELGLAQVKCLHARAEDLGQGVSRETFDVVTSRAVARLNTLCEYALPLVRVGGRFLAYKSDVEEELAQAGNAVRLLGGRVEKVCRYEFLGMKRSVVIIRKDAATPKKYPRGKGKERSAPLV